MLTIVLAVVAFGLAGAQYWLNEALGSGAFGRTRPWSVFGPLALWLLADVASVLLLAHALAGRRMYAVGLTLLALACGVGTWAAWAGVTSLMQVI